MIWQKEDWWIKRGHSDPVLVVTLVQFELPVTFSTTSLPSYPSPPNHIRLLSLVPAGDANGEKSNIHTGEDLTLGQPSNQ